MHAGLKPYARMKDSGVEELVGQVPSHWHVRRLGQIGAILKGHGGSKEDEVDEGIPCVRYGDLYTTHDHAIVGSRSFVSPATAAEYTPIRFGDVLFAASGETIDEIGKSAVNLMQTKACCGGDVILFRPRERLEPRFMGYAADSRIASLQKARLGRGFTVVHIYAHQIKRIVLAFPPLCEQAAIAGFLDRATARIERYIRAKQKLIELSKEKKQAIIHRAVTGQIDLQTGRPYSAYKDSGVACLGEVPAHWETRRLKSLVTRIDQGVSPQAENRLAEGDTWGVLKAGCANGGRFRESEHKRLPTGFRFDQELAIANGDTLVCRANGSPHFVGSAARVSHLTRNLILSDKTFRPIFAPEIDAGFMLLAMNSRYYREQVRQATSGAEGLANNLPISSLRSFRFAVPPLAEQRLVVRFAQHELGRFEQATVGLGAEIALLQEYRKRLITDVVTGKLDVRSVPLEGPDTRSGVEHEAGSGPAFQ